MSDLDDEMLERVTFSTKHTESIEEKNMFKFLDNLVQKEHERIHRHNFFFRMLRNGEETTEVVGVEGELNLIAETHEKNSKKLPKTHTDYSIWKSLKEQHNNNTGQVHQFFNFSSGGKRTSYLSDYFEDYYKDQSQNKNEGKNNLDYLKYLSHKDQMMNATLTGISTNLGSRHILSKRKQKSLNLTLDMPLSCFSSEKKAVDTLNDILRMIKGMNINKDMKGRWIYTKKNLVETMQRAINTNLLPEYLNRKILIPTKNIYMPKVIFLWLIRTASSGNEIGTYLRHGARRMSITVMDIKMPIIDMNSDYTNRMNEKSYPFELNDFLLDFFNQFRISVEGISVLSCTNTAANNVNSDRPGQEILEIGEPYNEYFNNEVGLRHWLEIWSSIFDNNLVSAQNNNRCTEVVILHQKYNLNPHIVNDNSLLLTLVEKSLVTLIKIGLDPCFHSGSSLLNARNNLICSIFEWITRRVKFGTAVKDVEIISSSFLNWIDNVAEKSIVVCSNLPPDIREAVDVDDKDGWLPISMAVRTYNPDNKMKLSLVIFHASLAEMAAKSCIKNRKCWDNHMEEILSLFIKERKDKNILKSLPLRFRFLAVPEVTMTIINISESAVTENGPRFLATVDVVATCALVGILLFRMNVESAHMERCVNRICESISEGELMLKHFQRMEKLCLRLKKKIGSIFCYPHFRRAKELLIYLSSLYRHLQENFIETRKVSSQNRS